MTSIDAAHEDVAAYALNLMEPEEAWRFEMHMLTCAQCTTALAELNPVADELARVDAGELIAADQIMRSGRILDGMLKTAAKERGRTRALRLVSVAAGVVVLGIISVLALAIGLPGLTPGNSPGPDAGAQRGSAPAQTQRDPLQPAPGVCDGAASSSDYSARDTTSKVSAKVTASCATWGTPVIVELTNIIGPKTCEVVIRTKAGKEISVGTVVLPPGGFGTSEQPKSAVYQMLTAEVLPQIAQIVVREIVPGEAPKPLVTVSTNR
ncbi:MAG TPA: zf-HC2 domain-containing protein [Micromonosporaceae bacterium]|nr:zf-HC2 domain-containing protein [Micromonosporaceae bacterium]